MYIANLLNRNYNKNIEKTDKPLNDVVRTVDEVRIIYYYRLSTSTIETRIV